MARSRSNPFRQPPVDYKYDPLIATLKECRERVVHLTRECGNRLPLNREAEAVIHDIDALAKLLPEGAADQIIPKPLLPTTWPSSRHNG